MPESQTSALFSLSALRQDLRFARRMLVKSPLFTGIVVLTLALGIGLNAAVFSAVEALLLRPLPGAREASELVQVYRSWPNEPYGSNSVLHFWDVRRRATDVFAGTAAWSFGYMNVSTGERPVRLLGQIVSADFFSVLGVNAVRGRTFVPAEDEGRGAHPVAVLSDGGWQSIFGGDPNVVGRKLLVNGQSTEIIGVAPPDFRGPLPLAMPALWMPLMQLKQLQPAAEFDSRGNNFMNIIARLRPGISLAQGRARMSAISRDLRTEFPEEYEKSDILLVRQVDAGIHPSMRDAQVGMSAVVMVVVFLLLLIACVNVANLFLARARDRAREMAIRLALGARRSALVRQLLVESLLFSVVAGAAGLLLAWGTITLGNGITLPVDADFRPDFRLSPLVLTFSLAVTMLTGVLFGLAPALQATRPELIPALKGEAPAGGGRSRMTRGLVVAQMALSMVLLVCSGLFLANLRNATSVDKGFQGGNLLLGDLDPGLQGYSRSATEIFYRQLTERLAANPAIRSVGMADVMPLGTSNDTRGVEIPGYVPAKGEGMSIATSAVSPGYFRTMGIPLTKGREFTPQDDSNAVHALVVNQRFADRFWPGQDALGRTVHNGRRDYTVIGVVPTGRYRSLGEAPTEFMWFAQAQSWSSHMTVVLRTVGEPNSMIATLRNEVTALDANLPLSDIRSMDRHLGYTMLPARVTGAALGVFGVLGLLLASVGMYGVMAYSVSQRTREIGIRMAIGASPADVIRLVMRQGLTLVLIGTAIGLVGALGASRLLGSILYGGSALDPLTFALVPLVLIGVAAAASYVPARRAAAVDPAITLRSD